MQTEPSTFRKLWRTALVTAPLFAVLLITPPFLLIPSWKFNFFQVWGLVSLAIFINWSVNLGLLTYIRKPWVWTWIRIPLVTVFMVSVSHWAPVPEEVFNLPRGVATLIRFANISSVNILVFLIVDLIRSRDLQHRTELENTQLQLARLEAELKLLKDQVNPHFLFNALSTAKSLVRKHPELAEEYLIRLSDFLRASISIQHIRLPLREEWKLAEDFIALNRIRFGNAFEVEVRLSPEHLDRELPYFSLVSLLENALKHNLATAEQVLHIQVESSDNEVVVRNPKQLRLSLGPPSRTGLRNLNERCVRICGKPLRIEDTETEFIVHLPFAP
jgi:two-component system LytT family sensor kinase